MFDAKVILHLGFKITNTLASIASGCSQGVLFKNAFDLSFFFFSQPRLVNWNHVFRQRWACGQTIYCIPLVSYNSRADILISPSTSVRQRELLIIEKFA